MKKIVSLFIMMVGSFLFARATGQWGERIIIGDDTLGMLACPIEVDSVLSVKVNKRLSGSFNTACWRGYQGVWRLENDTLYLDKIVDCCSFFGNKRVEINTKGIFDSYERGGRIAALWYSGELRVVKGECILYEHIGFARTHELEWIYTVEQGRVVKVEAYHNSFKKAELPSQYAMHVVENMFNGDRFPELDGKDLSANVEVWPKLDGRIDSLAVTLYFYDKGKGGFIEKEKIENDLSHPYVQELKTCLELIPCWDVAIIRGEIQPILGYLKLWEGKGCKVRQRRFPRQKTDWVVRNDTVYKLQGCPVQYDMNLYADLYPELKTAFTKECLRGYTARWEIKKNRLFLRSLRNGKNDSLFPMPEPFKEKLGKKGKASWYSGQLHLFTPDKVSKEGAGSNICRSEAFCEVDKGKITKQIFYHNYFRLGDPEAYNRCEEEIKKIEWSKFPELAGKSLHGRILVKPHLDGSLDSIAEIALFVNGCNGKGKRYHEKITDPDHPYVQIFRKAVEKVTIWDVLYVRNKIEPMEFNLFAKECE